MRIWPSKIKKKKGMYLPVILLSSVVFMALATAIINIALSNVKMANLHNKKITAMSIAEAGINYYMWHLAHDNSDYCDGQTCTGTGSHGPYHHEYTDQNGKTLGTYDLYITPPTAGNSNVTVKAVGKVKGISPTKTIVAEVGMPSFTKYSLLSDGKELWIGSGEKITGTAHVNDSGIYNQGEITGDASSTELTFNHNGARDGVDGDGVFGGAKLFPVPTISFSQLAVDILEIRNATRNGAGNYYNSSNANGYHVVLQSNNYKLYKVNSYVSVQSKSNHLEISRETLMGTIDYPEAGVIFFEDNVWVNGTIDNHKVTIIAADPEENNSNHQKQIIIPNTIKYTNYDGRDKIGLITQTNIFLTRNAPSDIEIDAAMIAKNGEIRIQSYCSPTWNCSSDQKNHIKVYGSMAHKGGLLWTIDYGDGRWSGYKTTETIIDQNNVLNPPPKFPLTGTYAILSWREE